MKKGLLIFCIVAICSLVFSIFVFAHPGNTDGAGGHYDHSTGEYHYHHGYGEHDHYDMDGDGDLDCPYEKKQQTPSYSGGYASPSYSSNSSESSGEFFNHFFTVLLLGSFAWFIVAAIISNILSAAFKEMGNPANLIVSIIITLIFVIITAAIMAAS